MSDRPELAELHSSLSALTWSEVKCMAVHLDGCVKLQLLTEIERERPNNERVLYAMKTWLDNDCEASWEKVIWALQVTAKNGLAAKIHAKHCAGLETLIKTTPHQLRPRPSPETNCRTNVAPVPNDSKTACSPLKDAITPYNSVPIAEGSHVCKNGQKTKKRGRTRSSAPSRLRVDPHSLLPVDPRLSVPVFSPLHSEAKSKPVPPWSSNVDQGPYCAASPQVVASTSAGSGPSAIDRSSTSVQDSPASLAGSGEVGPNGAKIRAIVEEAARLQAQFVTVLTHTKICFVEKEAKSGKFLTEFRITLTTLPLSNKHQHTCFLRQEKERIKMAKDIEEIFDILEPYLNYVDYAFLEYLVKEFGTGQLQQEMRAYIADLEQFEKKTTVEDFDSATLEVRNVPAYFSTATVIQNKKAAECTLYEVRQFKNNVVNRASLNGYAVYLKGVHCSSVQIILAFPQESVEVLPAVFGVPFMLMHKVVSLTFDWKKQDESGAERWKERPVPSFPSSSMPHHGSHVLFVSRAPGPEAVSSTTPSADSAPVKRKIEAGESSEEGEVTIKRMRRGYAGPRGYVGPRVSRGMGRMVSRRRRARRPEHSGHSTPVTVESTRTFAVSEGLAEGEVAIERVRGEVRPMVYAFPGSLTGSVALPQQHTVVARPVVPHSAGYVPGTAYRYGSAATSSGEGGAAVKKVRSEEDERTKRERLAREARSVGREYQDLDNTLKAVDSAILPGRPGEMQYLSRQLLALCSQEADGGTASNALKLIQMHVKHGLMNNTLFRFRDEMKRFLNGLEDATAPRREGCDAVYAYEASDGTKVGFKWNTTEFQWYWNQERSSLSPRGGSGDLDALFQPMVFRASGRSTDQRPVLYASGLSHPSRLSTPHVSRLVRKEGMASVGGAGSAPEHSRKGKVPIQKRKTSGSSESATTEWKPCSTLDFGDDLLGQSLEHFWIISYLDAVRPAPQHSQYIPQHNVIATLQRLLASTESVVRENTSHVVHLLHLQQVQTRSKHVAEFKKALKDIVT